MNDKPTAGHMKVMAGILVVLALSLVAFGLGKIFGAGIGWLLVGAFIFLWAKNVRDAIKKGEFPE